MQCIKKNIFFNKITHRILGFRSNNAESQFGSVFMLIWGGAGIVSINAKLLGGKLYFLQSVSILGYCVFPINLAGLIIACIGHSFHFYVKVAISFIAFLWSSIDYYYIKMIYY